MNSEELALYWKKKKRKPYNVSEKSEVLQNNNFLFSTDKDGKRKRISLWG